MKCRIEWMGKRMENGKREWKIIEMKRERIFKRLWEIAEMYRIRWNERQKRMNGKWELKLEWMEEKNGNEKGIAMNKESRWKYIEHGKKHKNGK